MTKENNNSKTKTNRSGADLSESVESNERATPTKCLRNITIYPSNRQITCEENCKLKYPEKYRACMFSKRVHKKKRGKVMLKSEGKQ